MASKIRVTGDKNLLRMLRELPKSVERKINLAAVNKATTPILRAAKAAVPVDHGDLKKAMIKKITSRGGLAYGIIGADANYVVTSGEKVHDSSKEALKTLRDAGADIKRPSKYDHLVEYGHATKGGATVAANPFLERGWDSSVGTALRTLEEAMADGIEKEALKLGGG